MKQRSEMIVDGFETHIRHHPKSKTRYQWLRKKSPIAPGVGKICSQTRLKQFITLYLKKQKEDLCSGGAARQVACELKNLIQV